MKTITKKILALIIVGLILTVMLSVYGAALSVQDVTTTVSDYAGQIKAQFTSVNDLVKGLYKGFEQYVLLGFGILLIFLCFFGYSIYKILLFIGGAYVGFAGGLFAYTKLQEVMNVPGGDITKWIIAGLCGVLCALLFALLLKKAGVVLVVTGYAFVTLGNFTDNIIVQAILTCAVLLLSVFFFKYFFIGATSYYGGIKGAELVLGSFLFDKLDLTKYVFGTPKPLYFYVGLVLVVLGAYVQLKLALRRKY